MVGRGQPPHTVGHPDAYERLLFGSDPVAGLKADVMLLIRPVETNPGDDRRGSGSGMIHGKSSGERWENTLARNRAALIVESSQDDI
jgi:hypothetical protein